MQNDRATIHHALDARQPFSEGAFALYWKILSIPTFIVFVLYIVVRSRMPHITDLQVMVSEMLFFCALTLFAHIREALPRASILVVNGMAGALLGLSIAVVRLVTSGSFYLVFNLIAEPARVCAIALGVSFIIATLIRTVSLVQLSQQHQQ